MVLNEIWSLEFPGFSSFFSPILPRMICYSLLNFYQPNLFMHLTFREIPIFDNRWFKTFWSGFSTILFGFDIDSLISFSNLGIGLALFFVNILFGLMDNYILIFGILSIIKIMIIYVLQIYKCHRKNNNRRKQYHLRFVDH